MFVIHPTYYVVTDLHMVVIYQGEIRTQWLLYFPLQLHCVHLLVFWPGIENTLWKYQDSCSGRRSSKFLSKNHILLFILIIFVFKTKQRAHCKKEKASHIDLLHKSFELWVRKIGGPGNTYDLHYNIIGY